MSHSERTETGGRGGGTGALVVPQVRFSVHFATALLLISLVTWAVVKLREMRRTRTSYLGRIALLKEKGEPLHPADLQSVLPQVETNRNMEALLARLYPGFRRATAESPLEPAWESVKPLETGTEVPGGKDAAWVVLDREARTNLAAVDALLEVDLAGFAWPVTYGDGTNVLQWVASPWVATKFAFCRALAVRALWEAENGHPERAAVALERGFQMAAVADVRSTMTGVFGFRCERLMLSALEQCMNRTRWDVVSLRRVEKSLRREPSRAVEEALLVERASYLAIGTLDPALALKLPNPSGWDRALMRWGTWTRGYGSRWQGLEYYSDLIEAARLPLRAGLIKSREIGDAMDADRRNPNQQWRAVIDLDLWVDLNTRGRPHILFPMNFDRRCGLAVASAAIGVECWRRTHAERVPDSWYDLIPDQLVSIPLDPADNRPLRYDKIGASGYRVYSCGADLSDDGGVVDRSIPRMKAGCDVVLSVSE
ncbi:MAG: hypothetical protein IT581_08800 [Verrucomicrobiales bacterium]|nr:hypothetical protein [Verrucomicrobiales bacterium]